MAKLKKSARKAAPKAKKPATFKSLKAAGRALKRKTSKPQKLDRNTPAQKAEVEKRVDAARKPVVMVYPKGLRPRPVDTRWPSEILVGKRHRKEFGDLDALAISFNERGTLIQRIAITENNELVAGQRRLKAWTRPISMFKDQPIPVSIISVDSIVAGEFDENDKRKDFTPSEKVSIKQEIEKLLKRHAAERQKAGKAADPRFKGEAAEQAAKYAGADRKTLAKAEAVVNAAKADPKRFGKLQADMDRTGKVDGPFKRLQVMQQTEALRKAPPPLPMKGPYIAGVVDFPWPGEKDADQESIDKRGRAMRGYPEMSIEEGKKFFRSKEFQDLWAPAHRIYFWTTGHHIDAAFEMMKAAGYDKHSTVAAWTKNKMGRGQVLRGKTEFCILFEKGSPVTNINDKDGKALTTDWSGDGWEVREDSQKPDAFFDLVEQHTPAPRYAEIFSRGGRNEKWDCHGDQVGKFAPSVAREAQDAILKEIQLTPDQQLLSVLEAVEKGETPDLRLIDKDVGKQLDKLIDGKKKFKLNAMGKSRLSDLRTHARFAERLAELPDDRSELQAAYAAAIKRRHDAVVSSDETAIMAADFEIQTIVGKWEDGNAATYSECHLQWSASFEKLFKAAAAPLGVVPMWGQRGLFMLDVDGVPVIVHVTHDLEITVFAADATKPFIDEDGVQSLGWGFMDLAYDVEFRGKTLDQYVIGEVREQVKDLTPPKKPKPVKKGQPAPRYLTIPKTVYALPETWDGISEPKPAKVGTAKTPKAPPAVKPQRFRFVKGGDNKSTSEGLNGLPFKNIAKISNWANPYDDQKGKTTPAERVQLYRDMFKDPESRRGQWVREHVAGLRGLNLACDCAAGEPCHHDVLIEMANPEFFTTPTADEPAAQPDAEAGPLLAAASDVLPGAADAAIDEGSRAEPPAQGNASAGGSDNEMPDIPAFLRRQENAEAAE